MILSKARKRWLVAIASVLLLIAIGIWSATSMLTSYINEYGEEYIGRKLSLKDLDLNPLSGAFKLQELTVYETNGEDVFLSLEKLTLNLDVWAFASGTYHIDKVKVKGMYAQVAQDQGVFNFQDIIDRLKAKADETPDTTAASLEELDVVIKEIVVEESHIVYKDNSLPFPLEGELFNAVFPQGFQLQRPELHCKASFQLNKSGTVALELDYDRNTEAYTAGLHTDAFNIKLFENLIKEQLSIQDISGALKTRLFLKGNLGDHTDVNIGGFVGLNQAALTDQGGERIAEVLSLGLYVDAFDSKRERYAISRVLIDEPQGIFHLFENGSNFLSLLKKESTSVQGSSTSKEPKGSFIGLAARHVVETMSSYAASNLLVDSLYISKGRFQFHDHTLMDSFTYEVSNVEMVASELYFNKDSIPIQISALLNGKGNLQLQAFLYPDKLSDLSIELDLENLDVTDVSPYCYQHLGRKVLSGSLSGRHIVSVKDQQLVSSNQISIDSFELGDKANHKPTVKVPLKTGAAALKNHKGVIELDLPIMGDLSNPNYKLGKTIGSIFKNLLVKAATSPTRAISKRRKRRKGKDSS